MNTQEIIDNQIAFMNLTDDMTKERYEQLVLNHTEYSHPKIMQMLRSMVNFSFDKLSKKDMFRIAMLLLELSMFSETSVTPLPPPEFVPDYDYFKRG